MEGGVKACCGVKRGEVTDRSHSRDANYHSFATSVPEASEVERSELRAGLVPIPGGIFEMGARRSRFEADLDSPRRKVKLSSYLIAPTSVTNQQYRRFVEATGYRTVAEREGWSFVFHLLLDDPAIWSDSPQNLPWWRRVDGACWSAPEGPGSSIAGREDHPVVHVAWYDALAYCKWSGLSLPSEAQWERAARGGMARMRFPWGNDMLPGGRHAMNTFQGEFPRSNTAEDGWLGTAPADAFVPNGYGLYNMTGNVWEWAADCFGPLPEERRIPLVDPVRIAKEDSAPGPRVQRGGSYLCHESYCDRYHVHSRTANDPDSSTGHCGFRVAAQN